MSAGDEFPVLTRQFLDSKFTHMYYTPKFDETGRKLTRAERRAANKAKYAQERAQAQAQAPAQERKQAKTEAIAKGIMKTPSKRKPSGNERLEAQAQRLSRGTCESYLPAEQEPASKRKHKPTPQAPRDIFEAAGCDPIAAARHSAWVFGLSMDEVSLEDVL